MRTGSSTRWTRRKVVFSSQHPTSHHRAERGGEAVSLEGLSRRRENTRLSRVVFLLFSTLQAHTMICRTTRF